jgi:hypothetical protein
MRIRIALIACLLGTIGGVLWAEREKPPKVQIGAKALCDGDCEIVGLLGKPYGTVIRVRGVWTGRTYGNSKQGPFALRITEIDGETLPPERQTVIDWNYVKWVRRGGQELGETARRGEEPKSGDILEAPVYESGGYVRCPEEANKILGQGEAQSFFRFRFYSFLYVIDNSSPRQHARPSPSGPRGTDPFGQ